MLEETSQIRVVFTVICGDIDDNCPQAKLALFREKVRIQDLDDIKARDPRLKNLGHYRIEMPDADGKLVIGRDVFMGIAEVPYNILPRDDETRLLQISPLEKDRRYLNDMFSSFFKDPQDPNEDSDDFSWLTWMIVPLIEAVEGRFNPIGMGGSGR